MTGPVFVDANVIVYSRDTRDAEKQRRTEAWLRHLWERGEGRVSAQVLHEYYVTVTRKLRRHAGYRGTWTFAPSGVARFSARGSAARRRLHEQDARLS
jgi:hypothetical protein